MNGDLYYLRQNFLREIKHFFFSKDAILLEKDMLQIPIQTSSFNIFKELPPPIVPCHFSNIKKSAYDILNDNLIVSDTLPAMPLAKRTIDWDTKWSRVPDTFQLYLHGLTAVQILALACVQEFDIALLQKAYLIIKSWHDYSLTFKSHFNHFVWGDHSTAVRTISIIRFIDICQRESLWNLFSFQYLYDLLLLHAKWLSNDLHYTRNHNHGVMQDEALLHAGYFLSRQDFIYKAL